MTYLQYNQINLGEGEVVDLEQDLKRDDDERSAAIRSFSRACIRCLKGFLEAATDLAPFRRTA